jgi:hypothetical protein
MAKTDAEIAAIVEQEVASALRYDSDERSGDRSRAIEYFCGEMTDLPAEEGRSSVVSHDVADVIGWILPGLMRVFCSSDKLFVFEPQTPADEEAAEQATDYVNYIFFRECDGYRILWNAFHDALLLRNGITKVYWDDTPETKIEKLSGIGELGLVELVNDPEVEILAQTEREVMDVDPETGEPVPYVVYDLKLARTCAYGKLAVESVPNEDFITDGAPDIDEARITGNRWTKSRSELIEEGYDRDVVEKAPGYAYRSERDAEEKARRSRNFYFEEDPADKSTEQIEGVEVYVLADVDDDGIAETVRAVSAGNGEQGLLDWEVWEDDTPYCDYTGEPVPHRWQGRSIFDDAHDIQRVNTVLTRNLLDNTYQISFPDRVVNIDRVQNKDAAFTRALGNTLLTNGDPSNVVANAETPYVGDKILMTIQHMQAVLEMRTGVSRMTQALDPEALTNQTATAVMAQQSAAYSKVELIARNLAELGLKRLGRQLLKLITKHQDRPRMVRLRDQWVEMDPRAWNADMDCTVNVGLGSGSRDRDLAMLQVVAQMQANALAAPEIPPTYKTKLLSASRDTAAKIAEAAGLKTPEQYFPELDEQDIESANQPQPSEAEIKAQADQQTAQMDAQLKTAEMTQKAEIEKLQAQADIATNDRKVQADMMLQREKFEFEKQLKLMELDIKRVESERQHAMERERGDRDFAMRREEGDRKHTLEREKGGVSQVEQQFGNLAKALEEMRAESSAPTEFVRGPDGRLAGARRGNREVRLIRGQDGRPTGAQ